MKIYAPDYYMDFKCIANLCKHSCCIGWEIDIDEATYEKYKSVSGKFAKKLHSGISTEGEPHFCLAENERCPFLNDDNLCDIIINLGEDHLCQICDDHPRFRNFFSDREEIGLGLCCEAAAALILSKDTKTEFILLDGNDECCDEDEKTFLFARDEIYAILQDRNLSLKRRIEALADKYGISLPLPDFSYWSGILKSLERLDNNWDKVLHNLSKLDTIPENYYCGKWETIGEQLLVYFVYRHLADGMYEDDLSPRVAFAIISHMLIIAICASSSADITEAARQYSSEIEYSADNLDTLLDILLTYCNY